MKITLCITLVCWITSLGAAGPDDVFSTWVDKNGCKHIVFYNGNKTMDCPKTGQAPPFLREPTPNNTSTSTAHIQGNNNVLVQYPLLPTPPIISGLRFSPRAFISTCCGITVAAYLVHRYRAQSLMHKLTTTHIISDMDATLAELKKKDPQELLAELISDQDQSSAAQELLQEAEAEIELLESYIALCEFDARYHLGPLGATSEDAHLDCAERIEKLAYICEVVEAWLKSTDE